MTKEQLRTAFINAGYTVQKVADWALVSKVENSVKYDFNLEKDGNFITGQIKVIADGTQNEEAEEIKPLLNPPSTFSERLKTFMLSKEVAPVFAVVRTELKEDDAFATVDVYTETDGKVSKKSYAVKERNDTFSFKEIV